jgi:hypothetical protein
MQNEPIDLESAQRLIDKYLACWNALDDESRVRAIGEMMAGIQTQMPGHRFEQRGPARAHHDVVHWGWAMCGPDGTEVLIGVDTASVRDGRIASLYGFFDA